MILNLPLVITISKKQYKVKPCSDSRGMAFNKNTLRRRRRISGIAEKTGEVAGFPKARTVIFIQRMYSTTLSAMYNNGEQ